MNDDPSSNPPDALPAIIRGLKPGELLARGIETVKMSSAGGRRSWTPPSLDEMARLFPGYEVLALLGHGSIGAVYKARKISLDRLVAIKLLPLEATYDREFAGRFRREAQTMARLKHPNLVTLYDFGETAEGHLFIAMEFIEGATLHDLIHTPGALTPERVIRIIGQVCEGIAAAHRDGVVHRDIEPANILVDVNGQAKIADFGLARSTNPNQGPSLTLRGAVLGTLDYIAPEQHRGDRVDQRADIYSLGVVLYQALTGQIPRGIFPPVSKLARVPAALDAVIARAMHADAARRFPSAVALKQALEAAIAPAVPAPHPAPAAAATGPGKTRTGLWLALAASLLVVAVLGYALSRPAKSVRPIAPHSTPAPPPLDTPKPPPAAVAVAAPSPSPSPKAKPSPAPALAGPPAAPSAPVSFGASRYQLVRSQASWMQAKTEAEFKGGHLAAITSKAEAEWVRKTFGPELKRKWARIWIGGYQADREDQWHWVTDEPFEFTDWGPGQPDSLKRSATPPFCISLSNSLDTPGSNGWDDSSPDGGAAVVGYLLEWDAPKVAPPVAMATPAPAPAATPAPAPAPATPAPDEAGQRIAAIETAYDAAYARDITKTFDTARDALRTSYQNEIDREITRATQSGKIADAVALRAERARAGSGKGLESDDPAQPEALKPLRANYRRALAKLDAERYARVKPMRDAALRAFDSAQAEFSRARKDQFALLVKQRRDALAIEWAADSAATAAALEQKPAPTPGAAAVDASTSSWRKAAQLALRFGGRLEIKADNKRQKINLEAELPAKRYEVTRIELIDPDKNTKLTDADLAPLAQCKDLEEFKIERAPVTAKGLESLRALPGLKELRLYNCPQLNDQAATVFGTLPGLALLEVTSCPITKEALKSLTRCTKLRRLSLSGRSCSFAGISLLGHLPIEDLVLSDLTDPSALDLSGFRQLRQLTISGAKDAKARIVEQAARVRSLEFLRLAGCGVGDDDLAKLATLAALKTLEIDNSSIRGPGLASLRGCRSLEKLRLQNCGIADAALEVIGRDLTGLRAITISGASRVQGPAFRALTKCRALKEVSVADGVGDDAVAAELAILPGLEILNASGCPQLSDGGLQSLARAKSLKRLILHRCTKLTDAGLASFRKARPDVNLERDPPKPD